LASEEEAGEFNDKNKKSDDEESFHNNQNLKLACLGEDDEDEDDAFNNMRKLKGQRYWAEDNPTIKCHNCKQIGHKAQDCPNDTKQASCILCGKDTHDSFDCTEKICFKCNKRGHEARNCTEQNIIKCSKCGHIGHTADRCLKIFTAREKESFEGLRCIECGQFGHIKCTDEQESWRIKISARVLNDLNEFINQKFTEAEASDSETEVDAFDYVKGAKSGGNSK
jgi:hypothetical protein